LFLFYISLIFFQFVVKEMPPRNTPRWYGEMVLLCTVFAITGSSTMVLVSVPGSLNIMPISVYRLPYRRSLSETHTYYFEFHPSATSTPPKKQVRPAVSEGLGLKGSMKDGPWSYRICSLVIMTPIYATLLVCVGTVFGRHHYFRHFSVKMWSRFGIPPEMMDSTFHETKKTFRKW
jgi:hypothetical protein